MICFIMHVAARGDLAADSFHDFNVRGAHYQCCQPLTGLLKVVCLAVSFKRFRSVILLHQLINLRIRGTPMQHIKKVPCFVGADLLDQAQKHLL